MKVKHLIVVVCVLSCSIPFNLTQSNPCQTTKCPRCTECKVDYPATCSAPSVDGQCPPVAKCVLAGYIINTATLFLYNTGRLSTVLTRDDIEQTYRMCLSTQTCAGSDKTCVGKIFPELATRYPDSTVEFNVTTLERPTFNVSVASVRGSWTGQVDIIVVQQSGARETVLALQLTCVIDLIVNLSGDLITGSVERLTPSITGVTSYYGISTPSSDSSSQLLDMLASYVLIPKLNKAGQGGVQLPKMRG